ncbi:MAG TPA: phosphatase PAP2 family protein [Anaerolineales bacterium]|nr:phosphatase PAP2 family protein [Anaerolineales bacterium]
MPLIHTLLEFDKTLSHQLRVAEKPGFWHTIFNFLAHSGDSWFDLPILAVIAGYAWLADNSEWLHKAWVLILGIFVTAAVVAVAKKLVKRSRPSGEWGQVYRKTDPHSFPSGHAARAGLLFMLGILLGPWWFTLLMMVWTPLLALARVAMGVHYFLDVLAGFILGIGIAIVLTLSLQMII